MMRGVAGCGLPDKEQTRAMVTRYGKMVARQITQNLRKKTGFSMVCCSLWICCDCLGGYMGATFGSLTFDRYDFQTSTMIMAGLALLGVLIISVYGLQIKRFYYRSV